MGIWSSGAGQDGCDHVHIRNRRHPGAKSVAGRPYGDPCCWMDPRRSADEAVSSSCGGPCEHGRRAERLWRRKRSEWSVCGGQGERPCSYFVCVHVRGCVHQRASRLAMQHQRVQLPVIGHAPAAGRRGFSTLAPISMQHETTIVMITAHPSDVPCSLVDVCCVSCSMVQAQIGSRRRLPCGGGSPPSMASSPACAGLTPPSGRRAAAGCVAPRPPTAASSLRPVCGLPQGA